MSKTPADKDLKLPNLSWGGLDFWLKSVDLIFSGQPYSTDRKYDCLKNYLLFSDNEWVLDDWSESPEVKDKYQALRNYILKRDNTKEIQERFIKGTSLFSCRDLKPSAFLYFIDKLGGYCIPKSIKRTIWLARLPRNIQKVMFAAVLMGPEPLEDRTLDDLAALADGIAAYEKYHSHPKTNTLGIELPEYVEHDPEVWFYSLDEAFSENRVTDDQLKCELATSALPDKQLLTVALFLTDLPNQPKNYANLRERVIKTFSLIQSDKTCSFIFRNMNRLKPRALLKFLNDSAVKSGRIVSQLLVRTFWIMQLPVQTQTILFKLWISSREPLQDLDINAMALVAEYLVGAEMTMSYMEGCHHAPKLEDRNTDEQAFLAELQAARSLQKKIALGMQYCDFMYRKYYRNNPSEKMEKCTVWRHTHDTTGYTARDYFFEGCTTCIYHDRYGEFSEDCIELYESNVISK